jgi:2-polyprenyl-6-hydroxyphenyl methylase/3-demethylubiquinone-9 3-methyltransferase
MMGFFNKPSFTKGKVMNVDYQEIEKFSNLASRWWDLNGEFKPLHQLNPLRLNFIKQQAALKDKKILDVGCGGGILAEALAQEGAEVTGIDLAEASLKVAKLHLLESKLKVDYQCISAEDFADLHPHSMDIITCMEMIEHVPDYDSILKSCAKILKPGGHLFLSTINRNVKSFLFAIVGAEYVLGILPRGTHSYEKFVKPSELNESMRKFGFDPQKICGVEYNPFTKNMKLSHNTDVNYMVHALK